MGSNDSNDEYLRSLNGYSEGTYHYHLSIYDINTKRYRVMVLIIINGVHVSNS